MRGVALACGVLVAVAGPPARAQAGGEGMLARARATAIGLGPDGALVVTVDGRPALAGARVRTTVRGKPTLAALQAPRAHRGKDRAGAFDAWTYPLAAGSTSALEVRRYRATQAVVGVVTGAAAMEEVELLVGLDGFARGLAIDRMKLHWTSPIVTSDQRRLGPANQLLLWQRTGAGAYHALVPLAADGMVGEVGGAQHVFRVAVTRRRADAAPDRVPLFAYGAGEDPYALLDDTYLLELDAAAFATAAAQPVVRIQIQATAPAGGRRGPGR